MPSLPLPIHDLAADEARDQPEYDPAEDGHQTAPFLRPIGTLKLQTDSTDLLQRPRLFPRS
jgi:hypothetical protein